MRSVILALLVIALVGTGGYLWLGARKPGGSGPNSGAADSDRQTTARVGRGSINPSVGVAGEIGPAEQVSVRPEVNGRIFELPVDVGDQVKKGGLLFALDDRDLRIEAETRQNQIESTKLQFDKARLMMEQAKRDYERDKEMFEARLLSQQVFETTRQRYESSMKDNDLARNSIERSEKDFALAQERLLKTRIAAPFDCTVLTRPVSVGQAVSGSGGFNSGTEVLTIADLSSMIINAHVNQADVIRLKAGMKVEVEVDAVPGLKVGGEVERIAPQATVRNQIKGYSTRIALNEIDPRIQPGMTASISIPIVGVENALTIPLVAVFTEMGGEHYVYARVGESYERKAVVVGLSDFFHAEIKSGLSEGDEISLEPPGGAANRPPGAGPGMAGASGRPPGPPGASTKPAATPAAPTTPKTATVSSATGSPAPAAAAKPAAAPGRSGS